MHALSTLIYDLTIMLGLASLVILIFQRIKQPVVLGYLVAGMIVGPYTPPHALVNDIANIQTLSQLGVIFLMFSLGLEFSFHKLTRVGFSAFVTGLIEVSLMLLIGYACGRLIGWGHYNSLFLGAALSISSTTIIIKAIEELNLKGRRFADLVFGVLIVEDLLAILLLVALSTIVITENIFSFDMLNSMFKLILVVGSWFIAGYFLVPPLFSRLATYINAETLTIMSVALCLIMVCIAVNFHYSAALGAFIMGSILAETTVIERIEILIKPIRDIFAAVFFISVGMLIDPLVILAYWPLVLIFSVITIIGKFSTTAIGSLISGQKLKPSVQIGFSMAQIGEFSFIIVALGQSLGVINNTIYPLIVAVSGVTTFTTPYSIRIATTFGAYLDRILPSSLRQQLNRYQVWMTQTRMNLTKKRVLQIITTRLIINSIIITIIFVMLHYVIFHQLKIVEEGEALPNALIVLAALLISSPFIWGMLFALHGLDLSKHDRSSINKMFFVIWFITFTLIFILSILFFEAWLSFTIIFLIVGIIFLLTHRSMGKSYRWFENHLVNNIKKRDTNDPTKKTEKKNKSLQ